MANPFMQAPPQFDPFNMQIMQQGNMPQVQSAPGQAPVSLNPNLSMAMAPTPASNIAPIKARGGMFAEGGVGRGIAGSIGDFLLQHSGAQPIYAPAMRAKQQAAMEEAQYQAHQQGELQRQIALAAWKQAHPDDPAVLDNIKALNGYKPGLGDTYATNFSAAGGSPFGPMMTDPATGQHFMVPRSPQTGAQVPQVSDEASYAAIPPGATYMTPDGHTRVKPGGQTPPASGNFPGQ